MSYNDIVGTAGVGLILIAYFCKWKNITQGWEIFYLLNIIGAALACYASLLINYWPFVILEGTWVLVSIIGYNKAFKAG